MADFDMFREKYDVNDLVAITKALRAPDGCPWDREQTHSSVRMNIIEEAYEAAEAIDRNDPALLREELGDLLLQVIFHSEISSEAGEFTFGDVCDGICRKLISRHPHVFGETKADTAEKVLANWDKIKSESKGEETVADRLESVPKLLPSLMRAQKVAKRLKNAGYVSGGGDDFLQLLQKQVEEFSLVDIDKNDVEKGTELGNILLTCCFLANFF